MTVDFKYENGQKLMTKLGEIGIVQSMAKTGSDINYLIMLKEGKFAWFQESDITGIVE
jgi:hypothetical protein